jgi:hypothetical protein
MRFFKIFDYVSVREGNGIIETAREGSHQRIRSSAGIESHAIA